MIDSTSSPGFEGTTIVSTTIEGTSIDCTIGDMSLDRARVMGILNITTDSFSDGGRFIDRDDALRQAEQMLREGADIIDIGGESTRPGALQIDQQEELDRVIPVIEQVVANLGARVSIDTSKPVVMTEAVAAGALMINDVRALSVAGAADAATAAATSGVAVCLMHMQGDPENMQKNPHYTNVVAEVSGFLSEACEKAIAAGIPGRQLLIDPGFGFGKTTQHNLQLLHNLQALCNSGFAVLAGLSRKRMFAEILAKQNQMTGFEGTRLYASVAAAQIAVTHGARIVRVHDVEPTVHALKVLEWTQMQGRPMHDTSL